MNSKRRKWRKLFVVCMLIAMSLFTGYESNAANEEVGDAFANEFSLKVKEPDGGYFSDIFVNDFADILSTDTISEMTTKADEFYEETGGISVVVTTLPSIADGLVEWSEDFDPTTITIEELATVMYNQYGIGKHSMGILVLLSMEEGEIRSEAGLNMEGYLPDSVCNRIVEEYGMPYFYEEEFDEGMISLQSAIISEIKKRVPEDWIKEYVTEAEIGNDVSKTDNNTVTNEESKGTDVASEEKGNFVGGVIKMILITILCIVVATLVIVLCKLKNKLETCKESLEEEKDKYSSLMNLYKYEINDLKVQTDAQIRSLQEQITKLTSEKNATERALTEVRSKYARAQSLHPELEAEIADMLEQELKTQASKIDEKLKPCLDLRADKDYVNIFREAIALYNTATDDVKKYVTSDIEKLHSLYDESQTLLRNFEEEEKKRIDQETANQVFNEIVEVLSNYPTGTYSNYAYLSEVYQKYNNLTQKQKAMVPNAATISLLKMQVEVAREDYDNFTAAEEAQKRVRRIVDRIFGADEDNLADLEEAYRYYSRLTSSQREYFDIDLYQKMMRLKSDAEEDHEREERRRRREADMHRPPRDLHYAPPTHIPPSSPQKPSSASKPSSAPKKPSSASKPSSAPKKTSSASKPSSAPKKTTSTPKSSPTTSRTKDNGRSAGGGVTKNFKKKS